MNDDFLKQLSQFDFVEDLLDAYLESIHLVSAQKFNSETYHKVFNEGDIKCIAQIHAAISKYMDNLDQQ
jgi:hypothetical protein